METVSLNVLVRACSALIRLWRTDLRAGSTISCLAALGLFCTSAVAQDVRIEHVTIVSPERSRPMQDASVFIRDDPKIMWSPLQQRSPHEAPKPSSTVAVFTSFLA